MIATSLVLILMLQQVPDGVKTTSADDVKTTSADDVKTTSPDRAKAVDKAKKARWGDGMGNVLDGLEIRSPALLLDWGEVRKEIGLTPLQYADVKVALKTASKEYTDEINRRVRDENLDLVAMAPVVIGGEHQVAYRAMRAVMKPEQVRRLTEVYLQMNGYFALFHLEFQDHFHLSPSQRDQIRLVQHEYLVADSVATRASFDLNNTFKSTRRKLDPNADLQAYRAENAETYERLFEVRKFARNAANREFVRILTRRQREDFEKAKGEPFAFLEMLEPGSLERNQRREDREARKAPKPAERKEAKTRDEAAKTP